LRKKEAFSHDRGGKVLSIFIKSRKKGEEESHQISAERKKKKRGKRKKNARYSEGCNKTGEKKGDSPAEEREQVVPGGGPKKKND